MKLFWIVFFLLFSNFSTAQSIEKVGICQTKTVSLVFKQAVISVDRGSEQVIVQKATDYVVKVKAIRDSFPESNLTVITSDGKLYSFILFFAADPKPFIRHISDSTILPPIHPLQRECEMVGKMKSKIPGLKYSSGGVAIQWQGWFVKDGKIFCKLKLTNRSAIGYDIDQFHLYIRDNNITRRTATQELLQQPLYISCETGTLKSKTSRIIVVALEKFTIPDEKHFAIEMLEKNGGRHLYLKINKRQLMTVREF